MLRQIINHRSFVASEILLVLAAGLLLFLWPPAGGWSLLLPLFPWCLRLVVRQITWRRTVFDGFILIFVITAIVACWVAYDHKAALHKFWLILLAVLFYYALSRQPEQNLSWTAGIFFLIGIGVCLYFFLTHDFVALPRKLQIVNEIGSWITQRRLFVPWKPIHPNYVAGVAAITAPFGFYLLWKSRTQLVRRHAAFYIFMAASYLLISFTLFMTTSRGVLLALLSAVGIWPIWRVVRSEASWFRSREATVFPSLIVSYLAVVVLFLYLGPASLTGPVAAQSAYGSGNRAELFRRSLYFVDEFPFTGGGLNAFPGLYSYYMLGIPSLYLVNSHNLFLDVAIEQGLFGGIAYLFLFTGGVWFVSRSMIKAPSAHMRVFSGLVLLACTVAMVHGMVDDYFYNGNGSLMAFSLLGLCTIARGESLDAEGFIPDYTYRRIGLVIPILIGIVMLNWNRVHSAWDADLGAIRMAQVQLAGFPTNHWETKESVPQLAAAEAWFRSALRYDPANVTANYRLGMIFMLRQDFESASLQLGIAHQVSPGYRGITKNLGYSYVWLGNIEKAQSLLEQIPESRDELGVYVWWWGTQNRPDLAERASAMIARLNGPSSPQP